MVLRTGVGVGWAVPGSLGCFLSVSVVAHAELAEGVGHVGGLATEGVAGGRTVVVPSAASDPGGSGYPTWA